MTNETNIIELATLQTVKRLTKFREQRITAMALAGKFPRPPFAADGRPIWLLSDVVEWLKTHRPSPDPRD